jgi:hypothetical protein
MAILQPSDFTDNPIYNIALTLQAETELDAMIEDVEKNTLQELLGCELYTLFIADLTVGTPQVPQTQIYIDIFDAFCFDHVLCGPQTSKGMKDLLMAYTYFEWHRYNLNKSTSTGMVRGDSENSNSVLAESFGTYDKYNRAVDSYRSIQQYIYDNSTLYPTFEGRRKLYNSAI